MNHSCRGAAPDTGEVGPFLENAAYYAPDGELPINTHGGQLSSGRLHGYGFLHEARVQLWREAGERQIAKDVQVAAVGVGGGPEAGCLLLRSESQLPPARVTRIRSA